jgi:hypothetical protein
VCTGGTAHTVEIKKASASATKHRALFFGRDVVNISVLLKPENLSVTELSVRRGFYQVAEVGVTTLVRGVCSDEETRRREDAETRRPETKKEEEGREGDGREHQAKPDWAALPQKSAKPTNDNSPPIHRWDWDGDVHAVRETDG